MRKLYTCLLFVVTLFVSAQQVAFDRLVGNGDPNNYYLGHYSVTGSDGLDIHWYGGIRLGTAAGTIIQINDNAFGIGTLTPNSYLSVGTGHGIKLSVGAGNWQQNSIIKTGYDNNIGDYTEILVPGYAANNASLKISQNGNASLQGKLETKEVKVTTTPTADFVFAEDYKLPKLGDVEKHIKKKKHLPDIASAEQMKREGVNVGEFQIKLLQKIEELTLYSIEQNKQLIKQERDNGAQREALRKLSEKLERLEGQLEKTHNP